MYLIGYSIFTAQSGIDYVKLWTVFEQDKTVGFKFDDQVQSNGKVRSLLFKKSEFQNFCPAMFNLKTEDFLKNRYCIDIIRINNKVDKVNIYTISPSKDD